MIETKRTDDERDHGGTVATGGLKTLDELLDLPYLDLWADKDISSACEHHVVGDCGFFARARSRQRDGEPLTFFSASLALGSILAVWGGEEEEEEKMDWIELLRAPWN